MAYIRGMTDTLNRQEQIRRLQMEDRREKEALAEIKRKTDSARTQATMMGLPKEVANAAGLGELEGWVSAAKTKEQEAAREEGRQIGDRDNKAMAAAALKWSQLAPDVQAYFARRTQQQDPEMARQAWESVGIGTRARALGVQHAKTLEKADDFDREMAKEIARQVGEEQKYRREAPDRQVELANKQALTAEATARTQDTTRKGRNEESRLLEIQRAAARDIEYWKGKGVDLNVPQSRTLDNGVVETHVPGEINPDTLSLKWVPASPNWMAALTSPGGGNAGDAAKPAGGEAGKPAEERRKTKDGKVAVFDSKTKKFLRYE
jgi:hypothetical protein